MDSRQLKTTEMLRRVQVFGAKHGADFPRGSNATKRFEDIDALLLKIDALIDLENEFGGNKGQVTRGLNPILKDAVAKVRQLDAPISRKYAENKKMMREWETASQVDYAQCL
ncbi:MAG TPA: hypothetical protein VF627_01730 [Abditibacterium sp.]|jgi:hypothetical protein